MTPPTVMPGKADSRSQAAATAGGGDQVDERVDGLQDRHTIEGPGEGEGHGARIGARRARGWKGPASRASGRPSERDLHGVRRPCDVVRNHPDKDSVKAATQSDPLGTARPLRGVASGAGVSAIRGLGTALTSAPRHDAVFKGACDVLGGLPHPRRVSKPTGGAVMVAGTRPSGRAPHGLRRTVRDRSPALMGLTWSWERALVGAAYAVPAAAVTLRDPATGIPLAVGVLPAAIIPMPPRRRGRIVILAIGVLAGASLFLGGVLAHLPTPVAALLLWAAVIGAAATSSLRPVGNLVLVLCAPLVGAGMSYDDYGSSAATFALLSAGAAYAWLVSLLWPDRDAPPRTPPALPPLLPCSGTAPAWASRPPWPTWWRPRSRSTTPAGRRRRASWWPAPRWTCSRSAGWVGCCRWRRGPPWPPGPGRGPTERDVRGSRGRRPWRRGRNRRQPLVHHLGLHDLLRLPDAPQGYHR